MSPSSAPSEAAREPRGTPPIFVGGSGRSGTTILGRTLGTHNGYALIPVEAKFHSHPLGISGLLSKRCTAEDVALRLREEWYAPRGRGTGLTKVIEPEPLGRHLDAFVQTAEADSLRAARELISAVFDSYALAQGSTGWIEMTPRNVMHASTLHWLFPEMKLVHIVRDGRDVAASLIDLGWMRDPFDALQWWERRMRQGFAATRALPPQSHHVVVFEDLMERRRSQTLDELFAFLGWSSPVEVLTFMEERVKPERAHIGRWRRDFDVNTRRRLATDYDAALERLRSQGAVVP